MDLSSALGCPMDAWTLFSGVLQIILIDLILAGDNAVVIALAVQSLPRRQRAFGISFGAGFAVLLRIVLTFFAAQLMMLSYVKLVGGILIFWIACKLLLEEVAVKDSGREANSIWHAVWIIVVADVTMSTDNILALAGASKGNLFLLIFGLILSIPLVVCASAFLARLMDRFPIIVYVGAAVLGKVSAELIFTDPALAGIIHVPELALYGIEAAFAASVIAVAKVYRKFVRRSPPGRNELVPAESEAEAAAVQNSPEPR